MIVDNVSVATEHQRLLLRYNDVRRHTSDICATLEPEDCVIQSMPDVSPTRWHLAHTTWFFETFVLKQQAGYARYADEFEYLFNSYYNAVGEQFPRDRRGLLSRPTVREIWQYRQAIDSRMQDLLATGDMSPQTLQVIELGLQHEQQHQELMLTDIKHVLSCNPLYPSHVDGDLHLVKASEQPWYNHTAGLAQIGTSGADFAFDNESPRHSTYMASFQLSPRLVTNGEFLDFIRDGGYQRPELWLSLGWSQVQQNQWDSPLYWSADGASRHEFTLGGLRPLNDSQPVTHVSYFEADAYARWAGARLPTEAEWEVIAAASPDEGLCAEDYFARNAPVHPTHAGVTQGVDALFGSTWQWTSSSYAPYPGYEAPQGALGEYNGKFMCNQYVLRGSSCATSRGHQRSTYRNFFPPESRWQFTGIRLARTANAS